MTNENGALPSARATHERSLATQSPPTVGIPNAHTPGPWEVAYDDKHGQAVVSGPHTEIATCWHHSVGSIEKQMRANARLIAAAPDLYEALEALMAFDGARGTYHASKAYDAKQAAEKALAKARGAA